ncbi:MAG TPA: glycoside hydrolase family 38 C-terminal domain-containing protein, partial [Anaerolineae bacterium]
MTRLAAAGKLVIGPWYSMPDEFTVSGESLIRNLFVGRKVASSFGGKASDAGYVPDMFGHTSQLPQILAGFNIEAAFIWRGVNDVDSRNFIWRGADGTEVVCHKFGRIGYGTYAHAVRHGHIAYENKYDTEAFKTRLTAYLKQEADATAVEPILLLDSCDHQEWDEPAYKLVMEHLMQADSPFELVYSSLDSYAADMIAQRHSIVGRLEGELREPGRATQLPGQSFLETDQQWMIPGVLSSRVWMKQANRACETALCQWAEPFSAAAEIELGVTSSAGFIDVAWRYLLENHAHDSIDGCSVDQVHRDMRFRFDQALLIANRVTREALNVLAAHVEGEFGADDLRLVVFNPSTRPFDGIAVLELHVPNQWPTFNEFFGYEPKPAFRIFGIDGGEIYSQRLHQSMNRLKTRVRPTKFLETYQTNDIDIALPLQIPALGYTTLSVKPANTGEVTRGATGRDMTTSANTLENEFFVVAVSANGTLNVLDKRNQRTYTDLLRFEDMADIGDGWYHGVAQNDQVFYSTTGHATVSRIASGPFVGSLRIQTIMRLPTEFNFHLMERSTSYAEQVLTTTVTLRKGQAYVDFVTNIDNYIDDHRVRVLFPSGAGQADTYQTNSAFDVVKRAIALRPDNSQYRELEVETKPQQSWTAVNDAQHGIAVVTDGLLETAVIDDAARTVALTLYRSTRRTATTDGEPDGQLHRHLTFKYRLVPLDGEPDPTQLCKSGQQLSAGLVAVQQRTADRAIYLSRP